MTLTLVVLAIVGVVVIAALTVERHRRVSERRRLQHTVDELQTQLSAMEVSERARSEFMATASHELRSPLTSIKGFAELLTRGPYAESIPARQREFVEIIGRSADRLVDLVNELLDVARLTPTRRGSIGDRSMSARPFVRRSSCSADGSKPSTSSSGSTSRRPCRPCWPMPASSVR